MDFGSAGVLGGGVAPGFWVAQRFSAALSATMNLGFTPLRLGCKQRRSPAVLWKSGASAACPERSRMGHVRSQNDPGFSPQSLGTVTFWGEEIG